MTMRHLGKIAGLASVALLLTASEAFAAPQKIGDVFTNVGTSLGGMHMLLSGFAYLAGLFFAIVGIFKFKDHVDNPAQTPLSSGVKRFLAGGMLLSSPYVGSTLVQSLVNGSNTSPTASSRHPAPGGTGMDQMIYDLINSAAGPATMLLSLFAYLAAIVLLIVGVVRLTKTAQEGPRGPAGLGTLMTFLASGALFSSGGGMLSTFVSSLFGSPTISTFARIDPSVINNATDAARVASVIEAVMTFIMIVGYIAFIRGWFVLKAFADGNSQVSLAQALTFLFGGALAINLGELVNVLGQTVGVNGLTFQ
jgi:hypothetical protein